MVPPIAALFVVKFDQRRGYKLIWSKSLPSIELEGVVDFKSLPSGLHNVKEDLVYFLHGDYAGISAFVNVPGDESQRNAQMLAVGALVPVSSGRLGKSWRHAEGLQELAKEHIPNSDRLHMLEEYWEKNRIRERHTGEDGDGDSPMLSSRPKSSPQSDGYRRPRAISDAAALMKSEQVLSPHHPAISLPKMLHYFGPLIFPLYRAALLRKRILMVGEPPVEKNCNFVYDLSVISSIPTSLLSLLPVDSIPPLRLRPLFNVGITDIPTLQIPPKPKPDTTEPSSDISPSWVACTTDDVLATKPHLYDILINLPHSSFSSSGSTTSTTHRNPDIPTTPYPKIYPSNPSLARSTKPKSKTLRATQRDFRRYLNLRSGLHALPSAKPAPPPEQRDRTAPRADVEAEATGDAASVFSWSSSTSSTFSRSDEVVEATPWALIAYTSFIWWASAGEKKRGFGVAGEEEEDEGGEEELDRGLLLGLGVGGDRRDRRDGNGNLDLDRDGGNEGGYFGGVQQNESGMGMGLAKETAIVGFFHRLTGLIFATVSDAISRVDGESVRRGSADEGEANMEGEAGTGAESDVAATDTAHESNHKDDDDGDADDEEDDENAPLLPSHPSSPSSSSKSKHKHNDQNTPHPNDIHEEDDIKEEQEEEEDQPTVLLTATDMSQMGLDVWSAADRAFVEEFVSVWWGRQAVVRGGRVQCCGVRLL